VNCSSSETTQDNTKHSTTTKSDQLAFLKISVDLQTALAAGTRRDEGQWLEQQLNTVKLRALRVGKGMETVCWTVGQHLELKTYVEGIASE
jgi:hypothetical protein